ncbi:MAG: DUF2029 domain-containing protein [Pirellulales bacterium]|nr:DUF2029 domain-containing protein [Pirellulales bacterium]
MPPSRVLVDFFQEWSSVQNWRRGLPIYEEQVLAVDRYLGIKIDPTEQQAVEVNAHPPASVLMAMPMFWLDYPRATLAWNLLSLVLGAAALWVINVECKLAESWRTLLVVVTLALLFDPLLAQTLFAQLNLLLLFLLVGAWAAARRQQDRLAGVLLGTAVAVKLYPALLVAFFAMQRRWRLVVAALLAALAWCGMTVLVFGLDTHYQYAWEVVPRVHEWRAGWGNLSVLGWWSRLFDPGTKGGLVTPMVYNPWLAKAGNYVTASLLVGAACWIAWRARTPQARELSLGLFVVTMLLISPVCWPHYLLMLVLPAAQVWSSISESRLVVLGVVVLLLPVWWPPILVGFLSGGVPTPATPKYSLLVFSLRTYALLSFWLFLAWAATRARQVEEVSARFGHATS